MALSWSRTVDLFPEMNPDGLYEIDEKIDFDEVEYACDSSSTNLGIDESTINFARADSDIEESHSPEKSLIRKIDLRLLPILGGLYAISLVDRVNVANARVAGMEQDLHLDVGSRYNTALLVFFIAHLFFGLPSNIILSKVGTANWLAFMAFSWGTVMLGQAFVKSYQALAVCRAILGFFGAGLFPGCVYLVSCWYVRYEVQKRLAAFYLFSVNVGGFSNILAYGLMKMEGVGGLRGWQWIFIIEGLIIQIIAIAAWFIIVDFPDKAHQKGFLTKADAAFMERRIHQDRGDAVPDALTWKVLGIHLLDLKLWAFAIMFMSTVTPAYAFAYFTPIIVRSMGYSAGVANLLSAPPVFVAVISAFSFAWLGDKYRVHGPVIATQSLICITGLLITAYHQNNAVRYFGIFLGSAGCQGNISAVLAYQSNNIRNQSKRAVGTALQTGFGAVGGIVASSAFRQIDSPRYLPGLWATASLQLLMLVLLCGTTFMFWRANRSLARGTLRQPIEGLEGFKYTL